mmetsp:Transcript_38372/g.109653  ORF Transcript_38372/g.109653 Transcript_38372/m.109653 type:complete len:204 (+) Transcript_38372:885-1496(+)
MPKVRMRVRVGFMTAALLGLYRVDCMMPTRVLVDGVKARPSIPLLGRRRSKTAGIFLSPLSAFTPIGDTLSTSVPLASKCTICGPYSSLTQKDTPPSSPSTATSPSASRPYASVGSTVDPSAEYGTSPVVPSPGPLGRPVMGSPWGFLSSMVDTSSTDGAVALSSLTMTRKRPIVGVKEGKGNDLPSPSGPLKFAFGPLSVSA